jgi:5-methylcytosine-specific restriction endonuclease McrA
MDTVARTDYLRPPDRDDVATIFEEARRRARAGVLAKWLSVHGDLRDRVVFSAWRAARDAEVASAEREVWRALLAGELAGRCQHGATSGNCPIQSCSNHVGTVRPSLDRYATGAVRLRVLERDEYRCHYCGREVRDDLPLDDDAKANIDHVIPWPEGRTRVDNLVTACVPCNRAKGNRPLPTPVDEL